MWYHSQDATHHINTDVSTRDPPVGRVWACLSFYEDTTPTTRRTTEQSVRPAPKSSISRLRRS